MAHGIVNKISELNKLVEDGYIHGLKNPSSKISHKNHPAFNHGMRNGIIDGNAMKGNRVVNMESAEQVRSRWNYICITCVDENEISLKKK